MSKCPASIPYLARTGATTASPVAEMFDATSAGVVSGLRAVSLTKAGSTSNGSATASAIRIASAIRPSSSEATCPSLRGMVRYFPVSSVDRSTAGGFGFDDVAGGEAVPPLWPHPTSSAAEIPAITTIRGIAPNIAHSPCSNCRWCRAASQRSVLEPVVVHVLPAGAVVSVGDDRTEGSRRAVEGDGYGAGAVVGSVDDLTRPSTARPLFGLWGGECVGDTRKRLGSVVAIADDDVVGDVLGLCTRCGTAREPCDGHCVFNPVDGLEPNVDGLTRRPLIGSGGRRVRHQTR